MLLLRVRLSSMLPDPSLLVSQLLLLLIVVVVVVVVVVAVVIVVTQGVFQYSVVVVVVTQGVFQYSVVVVVLVVVVVDCCCCCCYRHIDDVYHGSESESESERKSDRGGAEISIDNRTDYTSGRSFFHLFCRYMFFVLVMEKTFFAAGDYILNLSILTGGVPLTWRRWRLSPVS